MAIAGWKKGAFLLARLLAVGGHGIRVRRLGGDRAGEIRLTRFVRNEAVTIAEMVETAVARTADRCVGRPVLAIQDTTVVRRGSKRGTGLFLHLTLAVDAEDGAILGVAQAEFLTHEPIADPVVAKAEIRVTPFEAKQSARWFRGVQGAARVGAMASGVTVVGDRESDIFEVFAQRPAGVDLLVRARHDRTLGDGGGRMFARIDALPEAARATINLPAKPGRAARSATLAIRWLAVEPVRPGAGGNVPIVPGGVPLRLVDVREVDPPAGAEAVHWRLLTSLPVEGLADAFAIVDLYRRRWAIEQVFRTLKTAGFDIENLELADAAARARLVMASVVAAVTIQQLVHARDGTTGMSPLRPLTDAFDATDQPLLRAFTRQLEGKTARQRNPHPEGSLAYAAWVCARLGGWSGYYGKPGPAVMLFGWLRFQDAKQGAKLSHALV